VAICKGENLPENGFSNGRQYFAGTDSCYALYQEAEEALFLSAVTL